MKRNLLSILLVIFIILPFFTTLSIIRIQEKITKHYVKSNLLKNNYHADLLELNFKLTDAEDLLDWKNNFEFEYKNKMYDVVKTEITDDVIKIWCLTDYQETQFKKNSALILNQLLGNNQTNKDNQQKLVTFFKNLYSSQIIKFKSYYTDFNTIIFAKNIQLKSNIIIPLTPPPELFV